MNEPLVSVAGLHALVYCERLFYLEEVERIRVADASVFAGRRLHEEVTETDEGQLRRMTFESDELGMRGTVDVLRRRDGVLVVYEHKRGRSAPKREAWESDRVQLGAYAMLVEDALGQRLEEGRVRYHADNVTVRIPIDDGLRERVRTAVARARALGVSVQRPPVTEHEQRCERCSLARVCLPEEARLAADPKFRPIRLLPPHPGGMALHVTSDGAKVGREGRMLVVRPREGDPQKVPIAEVESVVIHGLAQLSTQALRLCADRDVQVTWMTKSGGLVAATAPPAPSGQRHLRQFEALREEGFRLSLARRLVIAKLSAQVRFVLRASRGNDRRRDVQTSLEGLRLALRQADGADDLSSLRGHEGAGAAAYFRALPSLTVKELDERLKPSSRSRQPARDRFSALLNYGYGMLYREVLSAILAVGLHPSIGFFHALRSSAHPLALDVMELFRVPMVDLPLLAALNRRTFDASADFDDIEGRVSLSDTGRAKLIELLERRRHETWRHDVVGYSLSYGRIVELEVRLLEKEWSDEAGLFAKLRIR